MKHLITISLLLFSFCSFGQVVDTTIRMEAFDPINWRRIPAYDTLKCKHIYVAVEQPEVNGGFSTLSIGRFGKHEGKEIVCIKCHHLRKQIVDYGQAGQLGPRLTLETRPEDIHNVVPPKEQ